MKEFIAPSDKDVLAAHGLDNFEALWALELENVDEPNTERGGYSSVSCLKLDDKAYFIKRQSNHLTHSLHAPLGEPTFAREFRNIKLYDELGIPAVTAAYFGYRKKNHQKQAILITHALEGWHDLDSYLPNWTTRAEDEKQSIIKACALLLKQLHGKKVLHGCFYPKHIFLKTDNKKQFKACLIDLEKTRKLNLGTRERLKDIDTLARRTNLVWSEDDYCFFLSIYLEKPKDSAEVSQWLKRMVRRSHTKEMRG